MAIKLENKHVMNGVAVIIGFIAAILIGMLGWLNDSWLAVFVTFGALIGLLNVTHRETSQFLMSGTVLVIVSVLGQSVMTTFPRVNDVLFAILAVFVPATLIVAIKNVFTIAKEHR